MEVEAYSEAYFIVGADVVPFPGDTITVADDTMEYLREYVRAPIFKAGNGHHPAQTQASVPAGTIAVPNDLEDEARDHLLMARRGHALDLIMDNQVVHPDERVGHA